MSDLATASPPHQSHKTGFFDLFRRALRTLGHIPGLEQQDVEDFDFGPHEQPVLPGSPHAPVHAPARRILFGAMALLMGITSSLGNSLVQVNVANIAGAMGLTVSEAWWLPAMYIAFNCSANLLLVRSRIQFGIQPVTNGLLVAYILAAIVRLIVPGFATELLVRAVSGLIGSGLLALAIFNAIQVFPAKLRPAALMVGVSISPLSTPLARLVPLDVLTAHAMRGLDLMELGMGVFALAAFAMFPLPPSNRSPAFEPLDLVTIALFIPAITLLSGVLAQGRLLWWTDTPWLGVALAVSAALLAGVAVVELNRKTPLLEVKWIVSRDIARFIIFAFLVRLALAEQTYGAVGLLTAGGLTDDQLHVLFALVLLAMVGGIVVAAATLSVPSLPYQVLVAILLISAGSFLDSTASSVTRPQQLYLSQVLIAFGASLFFGPSLLLGFIQVLAKGPTFFVSVIVMFSLAQNIGGLAGSALLGSYQTLAQQAHVQAMARSMLSTDPLVAARLQQGVVPLSQAVTREASYAAYDDVFRLVAVMALLTAAYIAYTIVFNLLMARREARLKAIEGVQA